MANVRQMAPEDLLSINPLLVRAFTQARRDDGYAKPEIPLCTMDFLRFYLEETPAACWVAVQERHIIGAVFGHCWGASGWIGPLAVAPEWQHQGLGQALMAAALTSLHDAGCSCVGLETSPRSVRNIAFYLRLGLVAGPLMCDLAFSLKERNTEDPSLCLQTFSRNPDMLSAITAPLLHDLDSHMDYLHIARHLQRWAFGESYLLSGTAGSEAFAAVQHATISSREMQGVARVLCFAGSRTLSLQRMRAFLTTIAQAAGATYITVRIPVYHQALITELLTRGWRLVKSHLRMYEPGAASPQGQSGIHLNKWD